MKLVVISGMSGAGKSIALQVLEDRDYYCVDNLPLVLLPRFSEQMLRLAGQHGIDKFAVGIDARNFIADLQSYGRLLSEVAAQGMQCETVFLEANHEVLVKRFSETRRRHPLSADNVSLLEAIENERGLLSPIADVADIKFETSDLNVHQLRELITERVIGRADKLSVQLVSFGFKKGVPGDADFVFDVRCLPNPYWDPALRIYTGKHREVEQFLEREEMVIDMLNDLYQFLDKWVQNFSIGGRSYLTVAIGCTGGRHRSVYLVERLAEKLSPGCGDVLVRHREL